MLKIVGVLLFILLVGCICWGVFPFYISIPNNIPLTLFVMAIPVILLTVGLLIIWSKKE